jgi:sulfite reductase alpha subunit-like flavoprotein
LKVLSQLAQQPEGYEVTSSGTPPPRVVLPATSSTELANTEDPMDNDSRYHQAKVSINERMTAQDWYQDVRHFEFDFEVEDAVKYEPGDVAVIHPIAEADDVQSFLDLMKWSDRADAPLAIRRNVTGK